MKYSHLNAICIGFTVATILYDIFFGMAGWIIAFDAFVTMINIIALIYSLEREKTYSH